MEILIDSTKQKELDRNGFVTFPLLEKDAINELSRFFFSVHGDVENEFYVCAQSDNKIYKYMVHEMVYHHVNDKLGTVLKDHKALTYSMQAKGVGESSELALHQDWTVTDNDVYRSYSLWIPLIDTTFENGGVCLIPGSHAICKNERSPSIPAPFEGIENELKEMMQFVPVKAGEALLFDQAILHYSPPNRSGQTRVSLISTVVAKQAPLKFLYLDKEVTPWMLEEYEAESKLWLDFSDYGKERFQRPVGRRKIAASTYHQEKFTVDKIREDLAAYWANIDNPQPDVQKKFTDKVKLEYLNFSELTSKKHLLPNLTDIRDRKRSDGVVIRNFLSADEIEAIIKNLKNHPDLDYSNLPNSKTFPCSFAEVDHRKEVVESALKEYFTTCKNFTDTFSSTYQIDVVSRLLETLSLLNEGKGCTIPNALGDLSFIPFTYRIILPEKCHIDLHTGNQFLNMFDFFYDHLTNKVEVVDQLSFFVVLNKPEIGGKLKIFNITLEEASEFNLENQTVTDNNGNNYQVNDPSQIYCLEPELEEGDLIIFSAGKLWHRVTEVYGKKNRVTLGGFIGYSKTNDEVAVWS